MNAIGIVAAHEWSAFFRRGAGWWMIVVVGVLGTLTVVGEFGGWAHEAPEREALGQTEADQWLGLGDTHIHEAAHRGYFLVRPAPAAVILDRGSLDFGGSAVWLEAHRRNSPRLRASDTAAMVSRAVPRGLGPVLLWLIPLLLALFLHGIVADERADGSLAFAVSSGAPPTSIVLGKAAAACGLAWAAAIPPMVLGGGLAVANGVNVPGAAAWGGTVLVGVGVFAVLVVVVSAAARTPLASLVTLLLIWFGMVLLVPKLAASATQVLAPIPSSQTIRSDAEAAVDQLDGTATQRRHLERLQDAGVRDPNPAAVSAMALESDAAALFARTFEPLETGMERQSRLLGLLAILSPIASADLASDGLLGVGDRAQFAFERRAESARIATHMALNEGWARLGDSDRGSPELWAEVVEVARARTRDIDGSTAGGPGLAGLGLVLWTLIATGGIRVAIRHVGRAA